MARVSDKATRGTSDRKKLRNRVGLLAFSSTGLFVIALLFLLWFGKPFFLPAVTAFVLMVAFSPLVSWLQRTGLPRRLGAVAATVVFVAFLQAAFAGFVVPLAHWIDQAPTIARKLETRLASIAKPIKAVEQAGKKVKQAAQGQKKSDVVKVAVEKPGLFEEALSTAPDILLQAILTVILLFYMLATRDSFREQLIASPDAWGSKVRIARIIRDIEQGCSQYLFAITVINLCLGCLVAAALLAVGMPEPILWGILTGLLNYIPFLGPLVSTVAVGVVAFALIEPLWLALMAPGLVVLLHLAEALLVRPRVITQRFRLNQFVVFLNLLFWGWMWGPLGAIISVPVLLIIKVMCDQIEVLQPFGTFVGRSEQAEPAEEKAT